MRADLKGKRKSGMRKAREIQGGVGETGKERRREADTHGEVGVGWCRVY